MDFNKALIYLREFTNYERFSDYNYKKAYNLDKIRELLSIFDNPQDSYFSVTVSGTKGKGSTVCLLASILKNARFKTATFTSPHLVSIRERIAINGKIISKDDFSKAISIIKKAIASHKIKGLTYFEVLTIAAFLYFKEKKADIAILEVGLGGRLDATNVANSKISVITPISYDHTNILGNSLTSIAKEKSGIIKDRSYVVSALQKKDVIEVIKNKVNKKSAKLKFIDKDIRDTKIDISELGTSFTVTKRYHKATTLNTGLIGRHQVTNSLTALEVISILKKEFGFQISDSNIKKGLKRAFIPGCFEIISKSPYIILDGAHNGESALALYDTLRCLFKKREVSLILGVSSDKDILAIGKKITSLADNVIFTQAESTRSLSAYSLAEKLSKFCNNSFVATDPRDALTFAKSITSKDGVIVITGSLFLIGDITRYIKGDYEYSSR